VRRLARWSDPPAGDPHRDVTGALHDISNALTVLLGWVSEARTGKASRAELHRALTIIEDRARSARDLARRAIGSQVVIEQRDQEVATVVQDVVEALSVEAQRARVGFVVDGSCPGVSLPLAADASQVLTNILMNALAWAPADSQVTIELATTSSGVEVTVRDEGPGVAPGQKDRPRAATWISCPAPHRAEPPSV
jgi:signal transduction histidine kinase